MWTFLLLLACRPALDPDPTLAALDGWRPDGLDATEWTTALEAWTCAARAGRIQRPTLAIGDLARPSEERRLWVVDLEKRMSWRTRVTHGSATGGRWATSFSNVPESHQTSLGLYRASERYTGRHGASMRLDGLQESNDRARGRAIVVHPADYAGDAWVAEHGRAGRSWGCPAVPPEDSARLIDALADGGALWLGHPEHRGALAWSCD